MIKMHLSTLVPILFQYQLLLKLYHWQTTSYARHKASDELGDRLTDFMDQLVEYGSSDHRLYIEEQCISIQNMSNEVGIPFLQDLYTIIRSIDLKDKGIKARRDDLLGFIHQTMYLFHLS